MKMNLKKVFCAFVCMLLCVTVYAQDNEKKADKLTGLWTYSAENAPYGYQDGTIEFKQKGEKLTAELKIQGSTIAIDEIKQDKKVFTCNLYIDGESLFVTIKQKGSQLEGMVDGGGPLIPVTFKPAKK